MITFATGIFMLTFALFMSARMGIYQEVIYAKYGKHAKEALYYSHCLPLAGFLLLYNGMLWIGISHWKQILLLITIYYPPLRSPAIIHTCQFTFKWFTDIYTHLVMAINSDIVPIPFLPMLGIPRLLLYLIGNTLTQYICISAVFILTTECASLTVTLVVTLRKVNINFWRILENKMKQNNSKLWPTSTSII